MTYDVPYCHEARSTCRSLARCLTLLVFLLLGTFPCPLWADDPHGVVLPKSKLDPEEEGYWWSYQQMGGEVTYLISRVELECSWADYFASIDDPSEERRCRATAARTLARLKEHLEELDGWLAETLPPSSCIQSHQAMRTLAETLRSPHTFKQADAQMMSTYKEWNRAKIVIDERPAPPADEVPRSVQWTVSFRPWALPFVYNFRTGHWGLSFVVPTELGTVTISTSPPPESATSMDYLPMKFIIDGHARYAVVKAGTTISFSDRNLRLLSSRWMGSWQELKLETIAGSRSEQSSAELRVQPAQPVRKIRQ